MVHENSIDQFRVLRDDFFFFLFCHFSMGYFSKCLTSSRAIKDMCIATQMNLASNQVVHACVQGHHLELTGSKNVTPLVLSVSCIFVFCFLSANHMQDPRAGEKQNKGQDNNS